MTGCDSYLIVKLEINWMSFKILYLWVANPSCWHCGMYKYSDKWWSYPLSPVLWKAVVRLCWRSPKCRFLGFHLSTMCMKSFVHKLWIQTFLHMNGICQFLPVHRNVCIQWDPCIRGFSHPWFAAVWRKKLENSRKKRFISFKLHTNSVQAVTWWNPPVHIFLFPYPCFSHCLPLVFSVSAFVDTLSVSVIKMYKKHAIHSLVHIIAWELG